MSCSCRSVLPNGPTRFLRTTMSPSSSAMSVWTWLGRPDDLGHAVGRGLAILEHALAADRV
jgi:hypothetical protein